MSSTERAPEPTMEEILASIRRIITDDETGQGPADKSAKKAEAEDESLEGEADNQIIDDIARVLSGSSTGEAPASEEEEILDLAGELGGLELVEDDAEPVFEVTEEITETIEVLELEDAELEDAEPEAPAFLAETPEEAPGADEPMFDAPEPVQEMAPPPPPPPQMAAPEAPVPPPAPEAPAGPKPSASEEAASALERAIAALRAGQVPTSTTPQAEPFQFQAAPQPEAMSAPEPVMEPEAEIEPDGMEPEPIPMAIPMPEPEPEAETHPDAEFAMEADAETEATPALEPLEASESELVLMEETEETVAFVEPEAEKAPFWPAEAGGEQPVEPEPVFEAEPEPEPVLAQMNGGSHHDDGPSRTLEDSIKDMLRPMLREWLDDNMPRIIRDELDADTLRRHQD
jgi:uncharacterized protein